MVSESAFFSFRIRVCQFPNPRFTVSESARNSFRIPVSESAFSSFRIRAFSFRIRVFSFRIRVFSFRIRVFSFRIRAPPVIGCSAGASWKASLKGWDPSCYIAPTAPGMLCSLGILQKQKKKHTGENPCRDLGYMCTAGARASWATCLWN